MMTKQEQDDVFKQSVKDAASDLVKRMIDVAGSSAINGDSDEMIIGRARRGLNEFVRGAKLVRSAVDVELSTPE
jgi:hypothetical protein